ncbi:hypothetical protein [Duganella callida]|uniref:Uncharacterized protein n=1 Tax=Duganella callida TaxID=2561932 RepID=A0A4Y9SXU4_9BURK|nr:hypothetical protein [Duganella callida]TFW30367.1 hypothetical protein E4L98_02345 [Duganella callida]
MESKIELVQLWSDEDMAEFQVLASDGAASFSNKIYVGHRHLEEAVRGLQGFKDQMHGGIYDLKFGVFGPEFGSGAFLAHLRFEKHGKLHLTVNLQTEFFAFGEDEVANEITLHLLSEPALLDDFVRGLDAISKGYSKDATLKTVAPSPW